MHGTMLKLQREISDGVSGLSAEQAQMRSGPGKWTIQQVFEHLLLTYGATSAAVTARVAKRKPTGARATPGQRVAQVAITTFGLFPKGRPAPPAVTPAEVPEECWCGQEMDRRAAEALMGMDGLLAEAEGLFGAEQPAISHMVLGPMSVRRWRRFHLVHGEHHLRQILRTRRSMGL